LAKTIARTVRYEARSHQEAVYTRQRSNIEANPLFFGVFSALPLLVSRNHALLFLGLDAAYVLVVPPPPLDSQAQSMPGSDGVLVSFQKEVIQVPAAGESLAAGASGIFLTDASGIAFLHVNPSMYDLGLRISHVGARDSYIVRRVQRTRTTTADWLEGARQLHLRAEAAKAVWDFFRLASSGFGAEPVLLTVVLDSGLGLVIHYAIEKLGTQIEPYYDWVVVIVQ
jgi:hypothetical protein